MTDDELYEELKRIAEDLPLDEETSHEEADQALVGLLRELGFNRAMDFYDGMDKWYA